MLSDYNCQILNVDRYKFHLGEESVLKNEFQKMIDDINILGSLGFHKLICQIPYNGSISPTDAKKYISSLKRRILKETALRLSGKFNISAIPKVYLSADIPFTPNLKALTVPKTNYIFLELPFPNLPEYVPSAINKILYTQKLIPVFSNFQIYNSFWDSEEISKLINIKGAAFQFDLGESTQPQNIKAIKRILKNGNTVLLGTSCIHENLNKPNIEKSLKSLKKLLGEELYMTLVLKARAFPF